MTNKVLRQGHYSRQIKFTSEYQLGSLHFFYFLFGSKINYIGNNHNIILFGERNLLIFFADFFALRPTLRPSAVARFSTSLAIPNQCT